MRDGKQAVATLLEKMDPAARGRLEAREHNGIPYLEAFLPGSFRAVFTTRVGGEDGALQSSFDLDHRSDHHPDAVARNRERLVELARNVAPVGRAPGVRAGQPLRLVAPDQVHGTRVVGAAEYVASLEHRQAGDEMVPCDGLTIHPELDRGLAPLLLYADCVPILLVGEVDMAILHGGWRGIVGGIVQAGAQAMTGPPGAAFIGPSIGPCCFEVSSEVAAAFAGRFGEGVVVGSEAAPRVDLWAAATKALGEMGVGPHRVVNPRLCTACGRGLFFSYRADGPETGRQGCMIWTDD